MANTPYKTFQNLPNKTTPVNATDLNNIQIQIKDDLDTKATKTELNNGLATKANVTDVNNKADKSQLIGLFDSMENAFPRVKGSGTSVTLNNTTDYRMNVGLNGNTKQLKTTGKNLCPDIVNFSFSNNGSATFSKAINILKVSTQDNNSSGIYIPRSTQASICSELFTSGYIFSCDIESTNNVTIRYGFENNLNTTTINATKKRISFLTSNTGNIIFYTGSSTIFTLSNFQVEEGTTLTDYEVFTDKQSSPSITHPQEIKSVNGYNKITIKNQNLFRYNESDIFTYQCKTIIKDETIRATSTVSSGVSYFVFKPSFLFKANVSYTFSINYTGNYLKMMLFDRMDHTLDYVSWNNKLTFTLNSDKELYLGIYVGLGRSAEFNNIQLEIGQNSTKYSKHNENVYPINFITSKNIFNKESIRIGGITAFNETIIGYNQTQNRANSFNIPAFVNANTTYTISFNNNYNIGYYECDDNNNIIVNSGWLASPITFTTNNETTRLFFNIKLTSDTNINIDNLMNDLLLQLETGSSNTTYSNFETKELYKLGNFNDSVRKPTGKNILDYITNFNPSISGLTNTLQSDGTITVSGVPTANYVQIVNLTDITNILKEGVQYRFSSTNDQNYFWGEIIAFKNGVAKKYYDSRTAGNNSLIVNKTEYDTYKFKLITATTTLWGNENRTISNQFQLEEGPFITEYEPFGTNNWYIKRRIKKIELTGNETINRMATSTGNQYRFYIKLPNCGTEGVYTIPSILCNKFISETRDDTYSCKEGISLGVNSEIAIYCDETKTFTVEQFKLWLAENNIIVYYILEKSVTESISDEKILKQLENIYNAVSYRTQTNITQENADMPFEITADALYDLDNLIARVAELEVG